MELLVIVIALFVVLAVVMRQQIRPAREAELKPQPSETENIFEGYVLQDSLMNGSEAKVFHELQRNLWGRYHVSTKVRLADIVKATGSDSRQRMSMFGRIKSRHVDFVIHDFSGRMVCAVEYDGPTHRRQNEIKADKFKDDLFHHIGLPLQRISHAEEFYGAIRRVVESAGLARVTAA